MKRKKTQFSALHNTSQCVASGSFGPSAFKAIYSAPAIPATAAKTPRVDVDVVLKIDAGRGPTPPPQGLLNLTGRIRHRLPLRPPPEHIRQIAAQKPQKWTSP